MIRIDRALFKDMGHITASEVATQEFPLTVDEIKTYVMDKGKEAYLATVTGRAVGHALVTYDKDKGFVTVDSIGVNPKFRRAGVGSRLLAKICIEANAEEFDRVRILVPSYAVEDKDDPWNVEHWLWRNSFKAIGSEPGCFRYGREYDWYVFERFTARYVREQNS